MTNKSYFINNPSSENIWITELGITIPPGVFNLFELREDLSYEQIDYSTKNGTLHAAIENGLCYPIPNPAWSKSFSDGVLIRKPLQLQILPSRARFTVVKNQENSIFASDEDGLFDDDIQPARELAEELKRDTSNNSDKIEATIKETQAIEKPFENRYVVPQAKTESEQQKLKNDAYMGYVTCDGHISDGKRCMRQAKKGKKYCGLHAKQENK